MEQFTSNGSDTANPLLKEPNPTVLYLIPRKERKESGRRKTVKKQGDVKTHGERGVLDCVYTAGQMGNLQSECNKMDSHNFFNNSPSLLYTHLAV